MFVITPKNHTIQDSTRTLVLHRNTNVFLGLFHWTEKMTNLGGMWGGLTWTSLPIGWRTFSNWEMSVDRTLFKHIQ